MNVQFNASAPPFLPIQSIWSVDLVSVTAYFQLTLQQSLCLSDIPAMVFSGHGTRTVHSEQLWAHQ